MTFELRARGLVAALLVATTASACGDGLTGELSAPRQLVDHNFHPDPGSIYFADVDGGSARRADLIAVESDDIVVQISSGSDLNPAARWSDVQFKGAMGNFFADVTGDGKADAITSSDLAVVVRRSDGTTFLPDDANWIDGQFTGSYGLFFADVTGDGRADAIVSNDFGVTVRRSDGTEFLPNDPNWIEGPFTGSHGLFFADVTGDGKADAIVVNDYPVTVRRSDGTRFLPNEGWTSDAFVGTYGTFFADVTGDGKADAIAVNDTRVTVRPANGTPGQPNGTAFLSATTWLTTQSFLGRYGTFFVDVTGDGKADAIFLSEAGVTIFVSQGSSFSSTPAAWHVGI